MSRVTELLRGGLDNIRNLKQQQPNFLIATPRGEIKPAVAYFSKLEVAYFLGKHMLAVRSGNIDPVGSLVGASIVGITKLADVLTKGARTGLHRSINLNQAVVNQREGLSPVAGLEEPPILTKLKQVVTLTPLPNSDLVILDPTSKSFRTSRNKFDINQTD